MNYSKPLLALFLTAVPAVSHASTLSNVDYKTAGDGLIVHDSVSNLDFLKFSVTKGSTPNNALLNNPGFHLATPTEALRLFSDAGAFTAYDGVIRSGNPDNSTAQTLFLYFGATLFVDFGGGQSESRIDAHVARPGTNVYDMYNLAYRQTSAAPGASAQLVSLGNCYDCSSSLEANLLVKTGAVPEPATFALAGIGVMALGWFVRKRRGAPQNEGSPR